MSARCWDCGEQIDDDPDHYCDDSDKTMVDLGGGMVVPLSELLEDD